MDVQDEIDANANNGDIIDIDIDDISDIEVIE